MDTTQFEGMTTQSRGESSAPPISIELDRMREAVSRNAMLVKALYNRLQVVLGPEHPVDAQSIQPAREQSEFTQILQSINRQVVENNEGISWLLERIEL